MNTKLSIKTDYIPRLIKHFYGDDDEMMRSFCRSNIESTIISSMAEDEKIMEWLASVWMTKTPKLLYRASRDGWCASDFRRMCDEKGQTMTVVKSSGGYIFGGYSDVSWGVCAKNYNHTYSANSFLFSLKDHAGVGPVKMPTKRDRICHAVYHDSSYGPTFGYGANLHVSSNANTNHSSYCDVGATYQLPSNTNDPHFLTGSNHFTVSEYQVFLV
jgi:hypothetical protein